MADAYWRYSEAARQQAGVPTLLVKRPRSDYVASPSVSLRAEVIDGRDLSGHYVLDDDRGARRVIRDTSAINASYDRYLRNMQLQQDASYAVGDSVRSMNGVGHPIADPHIKSLGGLDRAVTAKGSTMIVGSGRPEIHLPPDASSTLFVEGLPADCTRREVAHIFRPFLGYKEVRLVTKESRRPGGDTLVLCFVDFSSPAHAATAMDALQGYKFDENDRDSVALRFQFARHPGARSGGGHHGRR